MGEAAGSIDNLVVELNNGEMRNITIESEGNTFLILSTIHFV